MYSDLYLDTMKKLDYLLDSRDIISALHYNDNSPVAVWVREVWRMRQQAKSEERDIESKIANECWGRDLEM